MKMPEPFIKHFDDRYTQSREYQFLDLLNQLHIAVPAVISNESLQGFIKMEHVGVNLNEWLLTVAQGAAGQAIAFHALHQAVDISCAVAKKDVWHFDLAARNFMVELAPQLAMPKIRLIDFSLAVSKRFPLEKPLWMRPDKTQQHPALIAALQTDWENFFDRHNLPKPHFLASDFEIPMSVYQADWHSGLAADHIALPWCVLGHSIGNMLAQAAQCVCFSQGAKQQLEMHAQQLLSLTSEDVAQGALEKALLWMQSQMISLTPRPKARTSRQEFIGNPRGQATPSQAPLKAGLTTVVAAAIQPEKVRPHFTTLHLGKTLAAALVGAIAYFLIDTIYFAFNITVSTYTLGVTVIIFSFSTFLLLGIIVSNRRWGIIRLLSKAHGLALCAFSLEMWAQQVPGPWVVGICLTGVILFSMKYKDS